MNLRDVETIQAVLMRTVEGYRPDPLLLQTTVAPVSVPAPSRTLH